MAAGVLRRGDVSIDEGDVEQGRAELLQKCSEQREVVLLPVGVGDAAQVEQALARPAEVDEQAGDDLFRIGVVTRQEQRRRGRQRARVGEHDGGDVVGRLDDLDVREGVLDATPEAVVGDREREVGVGCVGDVPQHGAVEFVGADRGEQRDRVDALHRVEHDVGADDGLRRGEDGCGEPAAIPRVARAEDDVVTGAEEAGGEGLGDAAGAEDGDSHDVLQVIRIGTRSW